MRRVVGYELDKGVVGETNLDKSQRDTLTGNRNMSVKRDSWCRGAVSNYYTMMTEEVSY